MQSQSIENLVITGANEGIGYQTMKALYLTGKFNIVFGSRNMQRNNQAKQRILTLFNQHHKNSNPPLLQCLGLDLSSIVSIDNFVKQLKSYFTHIHILINNAGALFNTKQIINNELTFPIQKTLLVDYFSVSYLIMLLFKQRVIDLETNECCRIVNVSSSAHAYCENGMFEDVGCQKRVYSTYRQYAIAKFMLTLLTKQLARRLEAHYSGTDKVRVKVVALHPGVINTNIGSDVLLAKVIKFVAKFFMQTQQQGAQSSIKLTLMDFKQLTNGGYYNEVGKLIKADKRTDDTNLGNKLWELIEKAFKTKFQI